MNARILSRSQVAGIVLGTLAAASGVAASGAGILRVLLPLDE